ncbi:MAG: hypothetical protein NVS2B3_18880 [Vulcanimicrobiaceae bacterium]
MFPNGAAPSARRSRRKGATTRAGGTGVASDGAPRRRHGRKKRSGAASHRFEPATSALDLNRATTSELEALPGIGPALAERIVAMRAQTGPFASTDDLLDVGGMTQGRLDAIVPFVVVR